MYATDVFPPKPNPTADLSAEHLQPPMSSSLRNILIAIAVLSLAAIGFFIYKATAIYRKPLVLKTSTIRLPTHGNLQTVIDSLYLNDAVRDTAVLRKALLKEEYSYRSGQYQLDSNWTAYRVVEHLQSGDQEEARIVLTNARRFSDMIQKAVRFVEVDSQALHDAYLDPNWLDSVGYTPQTIMATIVPNTYYVYWDADAKSIRDRLFLESKKFWEQDRRREKADSLGLTTTEVYTLASIVESETNAEEEKATIAGTYLNRLRIGMPLQADPTVVFALGDFSIRRVLYEHLEYDSPYNTYKYQGLPPGPIAMSSIASLDAVLNPEQHDYLFFVTKGDGSGTHAFARDLPGHSANIRQFQENLRARGIQR